MSEPIEIKTITVAGIELDSALAVCPVCHTLDLHTDFDTRAEPWVLTCVKNHKWTITPTNANQAGREN